MHPVRNGKDIYSDASASVYIEGDLNLYSFIGANGRTLYGKEIVADVRRNHPGRRVLVLPSGEAMARVEAARIANYCGPLTEISAAQFEEMLNVLPPENWKQGDGWECFRMCEYTTGRITAHYLRRGKRYFTKQARIERGTYEALLEESKQLFPD